VILPNASDTEGIERFIEGQVFLLSYDSAPRPPLPPAPVSKVDQRNTEKERQLSDGRRGEGGGWGAESYEVKKDWPSINHSILSVPMCCDYSTSLMKYPTLLIALYMH